MEDVAMAPEASDEDDGDVRAAEAGVAPPPVARHAACRPLCAAADKDPLARLKPARARCMAAPPPARATPESPAATPASPDFPEVA